MKKLVIIISALFVTSCGSDKVKWDATGTFEATEITVSAEVNGSLLMFAVEEGTQLEEGRLVGQIDTVQLYLKKLQLIASRSSAMSSRQDIAKQIAATEQQIEFQTSEKKRFETLLSQNAATGKQVDDIVNQIAVLKKQLSAQRSSLETSNKSITENGESLEIQIAQVEDQLKKCRIVSPVTGTALVNFVEEGEYATTGKPLFTVADMTNIYLRAYITADQLTQMKLGDSVKVYCDFGKESEREYPGRVEWISSKAEFTPKTIQTREERANQVYAVKIAVVNDGYLKIGMYGEVVL